MYFAVGAKLQFFCHNKRKVAVLHEKGWNPPRSTTSGEASNKMDQSRWTLWQLSFVTCQCSSTPFVSWHSVSEKVISLLQMACARIIFSVRIPLSFNTSLGISRTTGPWLYHSRSSITIPNNFSNDTRVSGMMSLAWDYYIPKTFPRTSIYEWHKWSYQNGHCNPYAFLYIILCTFPR